MLAIGSTDMCRIWRNETGMALNVRTHEPFVYGVKGSSDIIGILRDGRFLAIEIKSGNASQSKQQKAFAAMIQKFGGVYFVCRSADEALSFVKHCLS